MFKLSGPSLKWQIVILLCVIGLVPLHLASWYYYSLTRDALARAGKLRLHEMISSSGNEIGQMLMGAASELKALAGFPLFREERLGRVKGIDWLDEEHKALRTISAKLGPVLDEACVIDRGGREVSRIIDGNIAPADELMPDESNMPFFQAAIGLKAGEIYAGEPYLSPHSHRWVIPFATPVADTEGRTLALIHFEINLESIRKSLVNTSDTSGGFMYLLDSGGNLLAAPPPSNIVFPPSRAREALPTTADGGLDVTPHVIEADSRRYWVMAMPINTAVPSLNGWHVVAALPEDSIFAELHPWHYAGFAAAVTLVMVVASLLVGRSLCRPMRELSAVAADIASGNLQAEVPDYGRSDEIGMLAASFRSMVETMRRMVKNLKESAEELMYATASSEAQNQELEIKKQELHRQNAMLLEITSEVSNLILTAAEQGSFDIRFRNTHRVRCWEVMEGCDPACPAYGSETFVCQSQGGGPCCRDRETGAPPPVRACLECPAYRAAHPDDLSVVGEHFNIMMNILQAKSQELDETRKQLIQSEKMSSIGQLAAGVAHEINNPIGFISSNMNAMSGYTRDIMDILRQCDIIRNSTFLCDPSLQARFEEMDRLWKSRDMDFVLDDMHKIVEETVEGTKRVARIVKNLKDFSHVDDAEWKPADIHEGLESTLSIIWNELKYKAEVIKEYGDIPLLECYPMQLNQVFMNLLVNAAQAIPEKGEIRIRTWQEDGFVCVAVSDTGAGMPDDVKSKIFNPFFTTKGVGKGTGLGLSIAYGIIEKHKGSIKVDSKVGAGTTFTFRLPVSQVTPAN